ncbi:MAG TPA: nucleotide exchange factor GrpE [Mycobacteriales bacterium]|nr:nucleotide exchange factor GrpE [Mycobacteriales bacterium]
MTSDEFAGGFPGGEGDAPVVRDKRRLDPSTGQRRTDIPDLADPASQPQPAPGDPAPAAGGGAATDDQVAELTADLQRVQAEYANYRRRVERDRQAVGEAALASVMIGLLPVLDDLDRARAHGEVTGGFALVADGLDATLTKLGLTRFGDAGEPFDPTVHEALTHGLSAEVSEPVCSEIYQPGYRVGERVLRPARVAVLEPEHAQPAEPAEQPAE